jgi:cytoskeleton protein RodZ
MSDIDLALSSSPVSEQVPLESGGSLLRQAREASGLTVSALASLLKVSTAKLDALESNRWDVLPDIVFARALAASVCRALQIEVAPVLAHFPSLAAPRMKTDEAGINTPFRAPGDGLGLAWLSQFRKPGTLAVLILIVAAVALFLVPGDFLKSRFDDSVVESGDVVSASMEAVSIDASTNAPNQTSSVSEAGAQLPVENKTTLDVSPPSVASTEATASPLPLTVNGSGSAAGTVVLKASGASWVEVVDGRGVVQVRKIMAEGEVLGASGDGPLSVVIGRADVVVVEVRGKDFNIANMTKNNIARFEVK